MNPDHHQEEWIDNLKRTVENYNEPVPAGSWHRLEKAMPVLPARRTRLFRLAGAVAAAAVILLFFGLLPVFSPKGERTLPVISVAADSTLSEKAPGGETLLSGRAMAVAEPDQTSDAKRRRALYRESGAEDGKQGVNGIPGDISRRAPVTGETNETKPVPDTENKASSRQVKEARRTEEPAKKQELTWEEYLKQQGDEESAGKRKGEKWIALSVGNNGVGTFDTRGADNVAAASVMLQDSPIAEMTGVRDLMLINKPASSVFKSPVSMLSIDYKHKQPLSFGLTFGKSFSGKFTVESGLVYSLLMSDIENLEKERNVRQTLHYLGIPVRFNWNFVNKPKYAVYTGIGGMVEKCVYGKVGNEKVNIKSVQTSLNFAVGAQYRFNETVGIYFEPGLTYYLGMNKDGSLGEMRNGIAIKSIHSENPLGFTLQAGFRFSF